jgi:integrase
MVNLSDSNGRSAKRDAPISAHTLHNGHEEGTSGLPYLALGDCALHIVQRILRHRNVATTTRHLQMMIP